MVEIREATDADAEAISQLIFSVLKEFDLQPDPAGTDKDLGAIEKTYFENGGIFLVAQDKDEIVATVALYKVSNTVCELRKMYLAKKVRGIGLGKELLSICFSRAKAMGFNQMILESASCLTKAIELYRRNGFTLYTPEHMSSRCDVAMRKDL